MILEEIKTILDSVEYNDKNSDFRSRARINYRNQYFNYNWQEPGVIYQTSDSIFKIQIDNFMYGTWKTVYMHEFIISKEEDWDFYLKKVFDEDFCF